LKKAVQLPSAGFKQIADVSPRGVAALHVCLSSPAVRRAKSVWNAVFGAQPPRGVIARVARLVGATLPDAVGYILQLPLVAKALWLKSKGCDAGTKVGEGSPADIESYVALPGQKCAAEKASGTAS
jgi:hypothetical protein